MAISFDITRRLDRFTLEAAFSFDGGTLIIEGESGAGKSTLISCIAGLIQPDSGHIVLNGQTVFHREAGARRPQLDLPPRERRIGFLFQSYALFPHMTVYENILYGVKHRRGDRIRRNELAEYAASQMDTFRIDHLREQYHDAISGGEKQRAAFARALATRPCLLLLDEPFSALDPATRRLLYDEFRTMQAAFRIPTILITHDPEESALLGDRVLHLHEGHIVQG